jgi:hypothetical protein
LYCRPSSQAPNTVVIRNCGDAACSRSCSNQTYTAGRCDATPGAQSSFSFACSCAVNGNVTLSLYGNGNCSAAPKLQSYPENQCVRDSQGGSMQLACNC